MTREKTVVDLDIEEAKTATREYQKKKNTAKFELDLDDLDSDLVPQIEYLLGTNRNKKWM